MATVIAYVSSSIDILEAARLWEALPWSCFVPSLRVDMISFLNGKKAVIRSRSYNRFEKIDIVLKKFNINFLFDDKGYVFFAKDQNLLQKAFELDISPYSHEVEFGKLLGYPLCCIRKIKSLGEINIDKYSEKFSQELLRNDADDHLNIKFYEQGIALISHIPCSTNCSESLSLAYSNKKIIDTMLYIKKGDKWLKKVSAFYGKDN
jgi:hypothetical protein